MKRVLQTDRIAVSELLLKYSFKIRFIFKKFYLLNIVFELSYDLSLNVVLLYLRCTYSKSSILLTHSPDFHHITPHFSCINFLQNNFFLVDSLAQNILRSLWNCCCSMLYGIVVYIPFMYSSSCNSFYLFSSFSSFIVLRTEFVNSYHSIPSPYYGRNFHNLKLYVQHYI